ACHHGEVTRGTFCLAGGGPHLERPVRPGEELVLALRRCGHDFKLCDGKGALTEGGADAVRSRIAAANDDDMLAACEDRIDLPDRLLGDAAVLLWQKLHREVNARKVAAFNRQIARCFGAASEDHRIELGDDLGSRPVNTDMHAVMEGHAFRFHLPETAV